jgi:hypothetical protein
MSKDMVKSYLENGQMVAHQVKGFTHLRNRSVILNRERITDPLLRSFVNCIFSVLDRPRPYE